MDGTELAVHVGLISHSLTSTVHVFGVSPLKPFMEYSGSRI